MFSNILLSNDIILYAEVIPLNPPQTKKKSASLNC